MKKFKQDIMEREHMRQVREKRTKADACRKLSKQGGRKNLDLV